MLNDVSLILAECPATLSYVWLSSSRWVNQVRSHEATPGPGTYDVGPPLLSVQDTINMRRNGPKEQRTITKRKTTGHACFPPWPLWTSSGLCGLILDPPPPWYAEYLFNGPNGTPGPGYYEITSTLGNLASKNQWAQSRKSQPMSGQWLEGGEKLLASILDRYKYSR